jgi:stage II sporulation protein D
MLGLLLAVALSLPAASDESEDVRILLSMGHGELRVTGDELKLTEGDDAARTLSGPARLACRGDRIAAEGQLYPETVIVSAAGPLGVLGRTLRGEVEVSCAAGRWTAINVLPLETYLVAVLGGEMPPAFPAEALKAQAVAARSYALMRKIDARDSGKLYHLSANVLSQVYAGLASEDSRAIAAVEATRGEVLAQGVTPVEAYFHASCGGETESGSAALGRALDYLKPVACPCQRHSPYAHWQLSLSATELGAATGLASVTSVEVISRTGGGRASRVRLRGPKGEEKIESAIQLRAALGYQKLPSTWFDVHADGDHLVFEGRGSGHGAGMCQWGAKSLAESGQGYREILAHYYPGTEIQRIY